MQIDFKDLMLFKKCPVKYDMKICGYNVSHKTYNDFLNDLYSYLLAAMFYHGDKAINLAEAYWEDCYRKNQDIISEKDWLKGVQYMCNIYDYIVFHEPKLHIIAVNHPYLIEFPEHGVALSGMIPMIANEGNSKQYIIIDPSFSNKMKSTNDIDHDIKYSAYSKAIRDLYNGTAIIINRNFNLNQESSPIIHNEIHYSRLGTIVKNTAECMDKKLYVPRDDYTCNSCKLHKLCTYWGTLAFVDRHADQTAKATEASMKRHNKKKGGELNGKQNK